MSQFIISFTYPGESRSGDVRQAVGYRGLDFRGKIYTGHSNLEDIIQEVIFKDTKSMRSLGERMQLEKINAIGVLGKSNI